VLAAGWLVLQASAATITAEMVLLAAEKAPWLVVPAPSGGIILDCSPVYIYLPSSGGPPRIYWVKWGLTSRDAEAIAYSCIESILSYTPSHTAPSLLSAMAMQGGERPKAAPRTAEAPIPGNAGEGVKAAKTTTTVQNWIYNIAAEERKPAPTTTKTLATSPATGQPVRVWDAAALVLAAAAGLIAYLLARRL